MKKIIITLIMGLSLQGVSQEIMPVLQDSALEGSLISLSSLNYYSSNRFNNDLMDKFLFGGEITTDIKDKASDGLKRRNTLGAEAEQRIAYYNGNITPFKNKNYGFAASISDNHLVSSSIATDLFRIAMYGNANYVGDTMDFSFTHLQYVHFQKFGIGLFDKRTMSSIQLNYVAGSRGIQGRLNDSKMISQQDSITLMLQGNGSRSDRFYPYWAFQGSGVAVDINYNFLFDSKKGNPQALNLMVTNLGLIVWNRFSQNYSVDSTTIYNGFDIQEFINQPEENNANTYNFVDTLGINTSQGQKISTMPIEFTVQKVPLKNSAQKLQYLAGFKTILTSDYFPYFFGGLYYAPSENFSASTRLSYGGFGGLQWGLDLNYWVKDKVYISLGTFDMIGNISKTLGFGRSANLALHFKL